MNKVFTLARRELTAYFFSPIAYIIGAGFLLLAAGWFFLNIRIGGEASLRPLFDGMAIIMVLAVPLLTMGLLSREFDSGTIETLMTSPVTDAEVILGKFLGVMVFYLALLGTTLTFLGLMAAYGRPDAGVAFVGYLGMVLLGAAYVSVGLFASTLTRHQVLSAVVAIAIISLFVVVMGLIVRLGVRPWADLADRLNAMRYFKDFSRGVLDTRGLLYFLSATALFLFLSVKTLESRRWR
ncbi:MAG TPA: ABC transporter permease subunit [Phycisphaerae bacterium]|nr:ABC transporter permease subunit [Phycisphaerae bacterium]